MVSLLSQKWGNPSSIHSWGERAAVVLETAREQVARLIHAPTSEDLIFTAGGTEADNLAVFGVVQQYHSSGPQHLIISQVEHPAIAKPAERLEQLGWQVTRLPVNQGGLIDPEALKSAIQENTVLVSLIYGQSEVGTIQPIEALAAIAKAQGIIFHTDAVQVAGRLPLDVQSLGVDLLSLSSHKIYGIQGAGALYVKKGVELAPFMLGGGQEMGRRSGTPSLPTIAAFGLAAELANRAIGEETPRLMALRDRLFTLLADCPHLMPTGDKINRLPHHLSFIIEPPMTGKTLVRQLNLAGIGISSGSACQSGKLSPSTTLTALGYSDALALGGIRLTLGRDTTSEDIEWTAMVIKQIISSTYSSNP